MLSTSPTGIRLAPLSGLHRRRREIPWLVLTCATLLTAVALVTSCRPGPSSDPPTQAPAGDAVLAVSASAGDWWQMPDEAVVARALPATEHERNEVLNRLQALLTPEQQPSATDLANLRHFAVASDPAEAIGVNYSYLRYARSQTTFWVKSHVGSMRLIVQPSPGTIDPLIGKLLARAEREGHGLQLQPKEADALSRLWTTYLALSAPRLDQGEGGRPPAVLGDAGVEVSPGRSVRVDALGGECDVFLWTNGQSVRVRLVLSDSALDGALHKVWGSSTRPADMRPLNAGMVKLQATDRWLTATGGHTTTPDHAVSALVRITTGERWRPASSYARGAEFVYPSQAYWVPAAKGRVAAQTWRACEFDALAMRALRSAQATLCHSDLELDLCDPQRRSRAAAGMRTLHADYDRVCRWYAGIAVPEASRTVDEQVRQALRVGSAEWKEVAGEWGRLLKVSPNGSPEEYRGHIATRGKRLANERDDGASHMVQSALDQVLSYRRSQHIESAIETEGP